MESSWATADLGARASIDEASASATSERGSEWKALLTLALVVAVVPFLVVEIPPIHDLPHHLSQARLYLEIADWEASAYHAQWLAPQNLIYVLLVPLWIAFAPLTAGKLFAYLVLAGTVVALFHMAKRRGRSPIAALGAALFAFNFVFYSGFFAFQLGAALVFVWLAALRDDETESAAGLGWSAWAAQALFLLLVAWAHTLWLGVVGILLLLGVLRGRGSRASWVRLSTAVPAVVWLLPQLVGVVRSRAGGGFPMEVSWDRWPWSRLEPVALVEGILGGVRGGIEPLLVLGAVFWVGAALWTNRGDLRARVDATLLVSAAVLGALWMIFPDAMAMTIQASRRWLPYAVMLVLVALPPPRVSMRGLRAAVVAAHLVLLAFMINAWRFYDRVELTGFRESLDALPEGARLLGLAFPPSEFLKHGVFLQTHAWAEVLRGAELNMSFTELGAGLVLRKTPRETPWTYGLSFFPHTVRQSDFYYFDYVLVAGPTDVHAQVERIDRVDHVTDGLPWRLYRVAP